MRVHYEFEGTPVEQFNLSLESLNFPKLHGEDRSLKSLRTPFSRKVINCGSSVSVFISKFLNKSSLFELGNVFLSFKKPSSSLLDTQDCLFYHRVSFTGDAEDLRSC